MNTARVGMSRSKYGLGESAQALRTRRASAGNTPRMLRKPCASSKYGLGGKCALAPHAHSSCA